jgi:hypothetical protein
MVGNGAWLEEVGAWEHAFEGNLVFGFFFCLYLCFLAAMKHPSAMVLHLTSGPETIDSAKHKLQPLKPRAKTNL